MPAANPRAWSAQWRSRNRPKLRAKRMAYHRQVMQRKREERLREIEWMNRK